MFKWLRRLLVFVVALVAVGILYEQLMRRKTGKDYPPVGKVVDVNGRKVHVLLGGNEHDGPTVVFEAGLGMPGTVSWNRVPELVSTFARTVCYDRAGRLHSDESKRPATSNQVSAELHELLDVLGEKGPFILVGHSLGGHHVRVFAHRYPDLVVGLILVDVPHHDWYDFPKTPGHMISDPPVGVESAYRFAAATGLLRIFSGSGDIINAHVPQTANGLVNELKAIEQCFQEARATGGVGERPLVVITATEMESNHPFQITNSQRHELQAELVELSSNSKHVIAQNSGHNVQDSEPLLVVSAIEDVMESIRTGQPLVKALQTPTRSNSQ